MSGFGICPKCGSTTGCDCFPACFTTTADNKSGPCRGDRDSLRSDIDRLRDALDQIANNAYANNELAGDIARKALRETSRGYNA